MNPVPSPQGEKIQEVHAQLLEIQRDYRKKLIREMPVQPQSCSRNGYILEKVRLPFSPTLFRELSLRIAPLLAEQCQEDFVPLLAKLGDKALENLARTVQYSLEQDFPQALEMAITEVRLHKLSPLGLDSLHQLLLTSFVPFFSAFAHQQDLNPDTWKQGWCPVCGQFPISGYNRCGDGRRMLGCWLCDTQWSFPRLECPVCGNQHQEKLLQLTPLGDKIHRIQVCEDCGHYLKITDCTASKECCDLHLENAATVHLDVLAQRRGYRPASQAQQYH